MAWSGREIELFETESGRCPVHEYIDAEERWRAERAKIVKVFEAVETIERLPSNLFKKLSGRSGLWEIRVDCHRFLGFFDGPSLVLTNAFRKGSQKTPPQEIALAENRRRIYLSRKA